MKMEMRVTRWTLGIGILLVLAGCAAEPAAGPSREEQVMAAQRAARPAGKPGTAAMRGDEADAVYKNYLNDIGKPLPVQSGQSSEVQ
jgi:hypothetical protein